MSKLYEISGDFAVLFDQLDDLTEQAEAAGVSAEDAETAWFDTLDALETEFNDKAENVALYVKELLARADAMRAEERRLSDRRKACEHRAARLKDYLQHSMTQMRLKKVDGVRACISIRNNPQSLQIADEAALVKQLQASDHDDLLRYELPELQKTKIKAYLQDGGQLDGCQLVQTQSLQIR